MHDAAALLIALVFLVVSSLIAPKGKRKLLWLFVWFMVFFADGFITSAIFHYYGNLYGKINVYEKPTSRGYYAGEKKFDRWFPEVNQLSSQYTKDIAFTMLISGDLDYIDYRVQAEDSPNNGKFFRVYVDSNTSNKCFMSVDEEQKNTYPIKKYLIPSLSNFTTSTTQNLVNIKRYIMTHGLITKREKRATRSSKEK